MKVKVALYRNDTVNTKENFFKRQVSKYLHQAEKSNQWSNWGWAGGELERRARDMFEIEESKSIIATCSGTTAIHAILYAILESTIEIYE